LVHVWYRDQRKLFVERKLFAYDAAPRVDYDPRKCSLTCRRL